MTETSRLHRIRFDRVELARGGRKLFDGLDLTISERRVGLIGDNGSGKSSLLRLINGLILPDGGDVWFGGRDTRRHRRELPGEIGFVFQNPDHQIIFPTVGEEVAFAFGNRGLKGRAAEREAACFLAEHGCHGWESRAVHELSGGERQRVAIISVLAARPSLLLLDEPFASLDLPMRMAFRRLIRELPLQIVMASHDLELLADCDRVVWLERGRIVDDGCPDRILPAYHDAAARRVMAP
ncbi:MULTISPECIES: ABC transporter ATP-binding protein [unclassified Chelatococcus]|uniref:energy-coupling factor ABC transporter ATP-binding protein n=1 Tax=unclassified Chelatococcus TaxID=2638111 RepID=UPI001BCFD97A|nr:MULTISPECIES: ABC transporter ATP-binding protein [unclassified Chelatococcus]MBS7697244.1 ABC transporter ATP-binding protein [Chelatococcus sp. YT9]MBX3556459.1 ABC transporter ATP-binding protein [Chelatococcus sp.]